VDLTSRMNEFIQLKNAMAEASFGIGTKTTTASLKHPNDTVSPLTLDQVSPVQTIRQREQNAELATNAFSKYARTPATQKKPSKAHAPLPSELNDNLLKHRDNAAAIIAAYGPKTGDAEGVAKARTSETVSDANNSSTESDVDSNGKFDAESDDGDDEYLEKPTFSEKIKSDPPIVDDDFLVGEIKFNKRTLDNMRAVFEGFAEIAAQPPSEADSDEIAQAFAEEDDETKAARKSEAERLKKRIEEAQKKKKEEEQKKKKEDEQKKRKEEPKKRKGRKKK
jgi:hypothetical protein